MYQGRERILFSRRSGSCGILAWNSGWWKASLPNCVTISGSAEFCPFILFYFMISSFYCLIETLTSDLTPNPNPNGVRVGGGDTMGCGRPACRTSFGDRFQGLVFICFVVLLCILFVCGFFIHFLLFMYQGVGDWGFGIRVGVLGCEHRGVKQRVVEGPLAELRFVLGWGSIFHCVFFICYCLLFVGYSLLSIMYHLGVWGWVSKIRVLGGLGVGVPG